MLTGSVRPAAIALLLTVTVASCSARPSQPASVLGDRTMTVASFDFPESVLLAELYAQALEAGGVSVDRLENLGPREVVMPALERGLVELVPEYSGAALRFLTLATQDGSADPDLTYRELRTQLSGGPLVALSPSTAQDQNAFAVTRATALRYGLHRLSDLRAIAPELTFGGPPECAQRQDCLQGLENTYGLRFRAVETLDVGGPVTTSALQNGQIDVGLILSSDGSVPRLGLVPLVDDRGLQAAQQVVPIVRRSALSLADGSVRQILDSVSSHLTTSDLQRLNARISVDGASPDAVASAWLRQEGLAGP
jgi:osmoprotectant transport system substrate-binding protein